VIDPVIVYSSLFGGGGATSYPRAIALDSACNAYIAGYTTAADFPVVNAAYAGYKARNEGFVAKMNATGTGLVYATYIGGTGTDYLYGLAVDSSGAVWATGSSGSADFPVLNAYQSTLKGTYDAVAVKLNPSGSLAYSTYLGGTSNDTGYGVAVDAGGNAYVTGNASSGFPTTSGAYLKTAGGLFATKFSPTGSMVYSTYMGGDGISSVRAIAVDSSGSVYVAGSSTDTSFTNAPPGGAQTVGDTTLGNAFVAKLNPAAAALSYFTFIGGTGWKTAFAIAVDAAGNAYVGGYTDSADFPTTAGALQRTFGGPEQRRLPGQAEQCGFRVPVLDVYRRKPG
jgi:hypothetical protein